MVRMSMWDTGRTLPGVAEHPAPDGLVAGSGRGLRLVGAYADDWGGTHSIRTASEWTARSCGASCTAEPVGQSAAVRASGLAAVATPEAASADRPIAVRPSARRCNIAAHSAASNANAPTAAPTQATDV